MLTIRVCAWDGGGHTPERIQRSEDNFWDMVLIFHLSEVGSWLFLPQYTLQDSWSVIIQTGTNTLNL